MIKHTPGPWKFYLDEFSKKGTTVFAKMGNYNIHIATIEGPSTSLPRSEVLERAANARLIAAAPEMLEVLKECKEYLDNFCRENGSEGEMGSMAPWDQINSVIKKVEGK